MLTDHCPGGSNSGRRSPQLRTLGAAIRVLAGGGLVRPPRVHRSRPLAVLTAPRCELAEGRGSAVSSSSKITRPIMRPPPRTLSNPPSPEGQTSRHGFSPQLWEAPGPAGGLAPRRVGGPLVTCCAMSIATTLSVKGRLPKPIDGREVQREDAIFMVRAHSNGVSRLAGGLGAISATGAATHRRGSAGAAVSGRTQ